MKLWRIATETREYQANDLSGRGAASKPGRWNDKGQPVIYCSPTIAIAVLETAAYINPIGLPLNKYLVEITVPCSTWKQRQVIKVGSLPATWDAVPAGVASVLFGSNWLSSGSSPILVVPSAIIPEENATLINPKHPLAKGIKARVVRRFEYNKLFRPK